MSFSYQIGKPLWKWFAKRGVTLRLRVGVGYDAEAKCYYVAWSDLPGINTDADTLEELKKNIQECVELLLEDYISDTSNVHASMRVPVLN